MHIRYITVQLPEMLIGEVDEILTSGKRGYSSRAEFIKEAIREKLEKMKG